MAETTIFVEERYGIMYIDMLRFFGGLVEQPENEDAKWKAQTVRNPKYMATFSDKNTAEYISNISEGQTKVVKVSIQIMDLTEDDKEYEQGSTD